MVGADLKSPAMRASSPDPPLSLSVPSPPIRMSRPLLPFIESSPALPKAKSLPEPALTVSLPFPPQIQALREQYKNDPAGLKDAIAKLQAANPYYICDYTKIVDHIDHIKQVAGIDYVGIGSDFDGVPYLPKGMNGMEDLVLVTYEMLRRGYTDAEVKKVLGENFLRAFGQAEKVANISTRQISGQGSLVRIKKAAQ